MSMTPFKLLPKLPLALCVLAAALGLGGCDSPSDSSGGARSGLNEADGSSFTPDPECSYSCVDPNGDEMVCIQTCPDSCQTIVMRREVGDDDATDVTEASGEMCLDSLPDDDTGLLLWSETCELTYGPSDPSYGPSEFDELNEGCDDIFSAEACEVALDLCLSAE